MEHPWLYDRCREVQKSPDEHIDLWARDHYKMLPLDMPVPTPTGWSTHGSLLPGDTIFGTDGSPCKVVAKTEVFHDGECYEIEFTNGTTLQCGAEHLWEVERRTRKRVPMTYKIKGGKRLYRESVVLSTKEMASHPTQADKRLAIRVNQALELPHIDLLIDPYVLGAWLGDGTSRCGQITGMDEFIFEKVQAVGYKLGARQLKEHNRAAQINILGLAPHLRSVGVFGDKHIPLIYLRASIEQRLELLRGLMDTDGHCDARATATFVNKSETLARGVYDLAVTLGLKPSMRLVAGTYDDQPYPYYHVSFQAYKDFCPFSLPRKVAKCYPGARSKPRWFIKEIRKVPSSPMSCIQVDRKDGMYLVGREMIPTHNSTIITFGMTIQDVLNNPEETVCIFSHTKDLAYKAVKQIMTEFDSNEELQSLFPTILWRSGEKKVVKGREKIKWSETDGLVVKRASNPKEPTIMGSGIVDGMPTSLHFSRLIYDDVVVPASVTNPEQIKKTTDAFNLSDNLGSQERVRKRVIGTRYHLFDTYYDILERKLFTERKHPATSDGSDDVSKAVFMSPALLAKKKKAQGTNFHAQMLLNPKADSIAGFEEKNIKYWPAVHFKNLNRIIVVDPSSGKHREQNKGDYTAMWCLGKGADDKKYGIYLVRDRLTLPQRIETLFQMVADFRVRQVFYEETGMNSDIESIKLEQNRRNFRFDIHPVHVKGVKKRERILRLQAPFASGDVFLPEKQIIINHEGVTVDVIKEFVKDEYIPYPVVSHDDALDALSMMEHEDVVKRWITPLPDHVDQNPILVKARAAARRANRPSSWMAG